MSDNYYPSDSIKKSISNFVLEYTKNMNFIDENQLRCILKKIILFQYLCDYDSNYYFKLIKSDGLISLASIEMNLERNSFLCIRSIIESFLRYMLNIKEDKICNLHSLFSQMKVRCDDKDYMKSVNSIENIYKLSCSFVHGNIASDLSIIDSYNQLARGAISIEKRNSIISSLFNVFNDITYILLTDKPLLIDAAFPREKSTLEYIIGKKEITRFYQKL